MRKPKRESPGRFWNSPLQVSKLISSDSGERAGAGARPSNAKCDNHRISVFDLGKFSPAKCQYGPGRIARAGGKIAELHPSCGPESCGLHFDGFREPI